MCIEPETQLEAHVDNLEKSYMPFVNTASSTGK